MSIHRSERAAGFFSWPASFNPVSMTTTIKDADDFKDSSVLVAVKGIAYFSSLFSPFTLPSLVSEGGTVNSEHVTNLSLGTSGNVVQRISCHRSCGAHLFYFYAGNFYLVFHQLLFSRFFLRLFAAVISSLNFCLRYF